jgi:hypothetical protein
LLRQRQSASRLAVLVIAGLLLAASPVGTTSAAADAETGPIPPSNLHITFNYFGCYIELAWDPAVIPPEQNRGSTDIDYYFWIDGKPDTIQSGYRNKTSGAYGDCMVYPQPGMHTIQVAAAYTPQIPSGYEDDLLSNAVSWTYCGC